MYKNHENKWTQGKITKTQNTLNRSYMIQTKDGKTVRRNCKHIIQNRTAPQTAPTAPSAANTPDQNKEKGKPPQEACKRDEASPTGNCTPVVRVTGENTNHYTIEDHFPTASSPDWSERQVKSPHHSPASAAKIRRASPAEVS